MPWFSGCLFCLQIEKFCSPLAHPTTESSIHGVGVSIAFEKIVLAMLEHKEVSPILYPDRTSVLKICTASVENTEMHSDYNWKNFTIRTEALSNTYKQLY